MTERTPNFSQEVKRDARGQVLAGEYPLAGTARDIKYRFNYAVDTKKALEESSEFLRDRAHQLNAEGRKAPDTSTATSLGNAALAFEEVATDHNIEARTKAQKHVNDRMEVAREHSIANAAEYRQDAIDDAWYQDIEIDYPGYVPPPPSERGVGL